MSAKIGHSARVRSSTSASLVKTRGSTSTSASITTAKTAPSATDIQIIRTLASYAPSRSPRAEHPPHDHLAGDRHRVEHEREEEPELRRDLVRGERRVAEARRHRAGDDERRVERRRADEDVPARA